MDQDQLSILEDHEFVVFLIEQIQNFQNVILPTLTTSKMNLFFIGKSGAGKSTLANGICGKKIIFKKDEGDCFIPQEMQSDIYFEIAADPFESKTSDPKSITANENLQIWDLPGYQDSRSAREDLKNILIKKLIIDNSNLSHIVILLAESQFTGDKGGFLIDIINMLSEDDLIPTIIISYAQQSQDINFFINQIEMFANNKESNLTQMGKNLLHEIVKQRRILKFQVPIQTNGDNYELSTINMTYIRDFLSQNQYFKKISLRFSLQDDSIQILKKVVQNLGKNLKFQEKQILSGMIKIEEQKVLQQYDPDAVDLDNLINNNNQLIDNYKKLLNNFQIVAKFIKEFEFQIDYVFNCQQDLKKLVCLEQKVQTLNILSIFCGIMSISRLKQILEQYDNIKIVQIYALLSFTVDDNFSYQGLSIFIKAKHFISDSRKSLQIDLQGQDGEVVKPIPKGLNQIDGKNGLNGNNGGNGGNLYVDSNQCYIKNKLLINVSGGNGSDGQDGEDGVNGLEGQDGDKQIVEQRYQNCESYYEEGTGVYDLGDVFTFNQLKIKTFIDRGKNGTRGGNAGQGGQGGRSGMKGECLFTHNLSLCEIFNQVGKNGRDGGNGKIGQGGKNGKDYLRSEYNVQLFDGIEKSSVQHEQVSKSRTFISIMTLGMLQTAGSIIQKAVRNGEWVSYGQYVDKGKAEDGVLNPILKQEFIQETQQSFQEMEGNFGNFVENIQASNQSYIFDLLY